MSTPYVYDPPQIVPMADIRRRSEQGDRFWFSPGAMHFFNSRVAQYGYRAGDRVFFVSSERFDNSTPRLYTVRVMDWATGRIDEVSAFQEYASRSGADRRAQREAGRAMMGAAAR